MKASYRTHPIIEMLENKKLGVIGFYEEDLDIAKEPHLMNVLKTNFYNYSKDYGESIKYITEPFRMAILKSMDSLIKDEVWDDVGFKKGTILNLDFPFKDISVMYYIQSRKEWKTHYKLMYYFRKNIFLGYSCNNPIKDTSEGIISKVLLKEFEPIAKKLKIAHWTKEQKLTEIDNMLYTALIAHLNFIEYANVETKELKGNSKTKDINCKYINDTKSKITIYDSTWFTNLVKSDAFKVRGHFRLQPKKKDGEWTKELIWINEFQKKGYLRKAKILIAGNS